MTWIEIINCEEDVVDWDILNWCELREFWDENEKCFQSISLINDILPQCKYAHIDQNEYDFDLPGRSGIDYSILTDNPSELKNEIKQLLLKYVEKSKEQWASSLHRPLDISQQGIAYLLQIEAKQISSLKAPAGYQGMIIATAHHLENLAYTFLSTPLPKEQLVDLLLTTAKKVHLSNTRAKLEKIIYQLEKGHPPDQHISPM